MKIALVEVISQKIYNFGATALIKLLVNQA